MDEKLIKEALTDSGCNEEVVSYCSSLFEKKRVQPSADHPEKGEKKHFRQSPPGREGNRNNGLHHIQSE